MTVNTKQERPKRQDFEQWVISTNQGYDLTRNQSGRMQTYEHDKTEYAWRGFFHGWQAARRTPVVPQGLAEAWENSAADTENDHSGAGLHFNQGVAEGMRICAKDLRAAAPLPPEAETDSLGIPKSCRKPLCSPRKHHPLCDLADHIPDTGKMVVAPVQLPELESRIDVLEVAKELKDSISAFGDTKGNAKEKAAFYLASQYEQILYWQEQVRQLLAAPKISRPTVDQVSDAIGYHPAGWDCANPDELIDAVLRLAAQDQSK